MKRFLAVSAVLFLGAATPVTAAPLACEAEAKAVYDAQYYATDPALTGDAKAAAEQKYGDTEASLNACYEKYKARYGEEAYRDLVVNLGE